jgi:hypothetical protein
VLVQDVLDFLSSTPVPPAAREEFALVPGTTFCIQRLRHSHHLLARALAEGRNNVQAAAISGYEPSTVASLKRDPAFQELLAHYQSQVDDIFGSVQDRLGALGLSFLDELQHRLETDPGQFKVGQLLAAAQALLDRSVAPSKGQKAAGGSGPSAISVNIRFAEGPKAPMLDITPETSGG